MALRDSIFVISLIFVSSMTLPLCEGEPQLYGKTQSGTYNPNVPSKGNSFIVDQMGTGDFTNIQDAINVSQPGSIIRVYDGTYTGIVIVNRTVSMEGNGTGRTIFKFDSYYNFFSIISSNVLLSNICVKAPLNNSIAINIYKANGITIESCLIESKGQGIVFSKSAGYSIMNSTFRTNLEALTISQSNDGNIENCSIEMTDQIGAVQIRESSIRMRNNRLTGGTFSFFNEPNVAFLNIDESNTINGVPVFRRTEVDSVIVPQNIFLILIGNCTNIYIKDHSKDGPLNKYLITHSNGLYVDSCDFSNIGFEVIWCKNVNILGCSINGSLMINKCINVTVGRNEIQDHHYFSYISGYNLNISDNHFHKMKSYILRVEGNMYMDQKEFIRVERNRVTDSYGPIEVQGHMPIFFNNNTLSNCKYSVKIFCHHGLYAKGNKVTDTVYGYQLSAGSIYRSKRIFIDNYIERCLVGLEVNGDVEVERFIAENVTTAAIKVLGYVNKIANSTFLNLPCPAIIIDNGANTFFFNNSFVKNPIGIEMKDSKNNIFSRNKFIKNDIDVNDLNGDNVWNLLLPFGGNYWSDYIGSDRKKGYYQDKPGSDGFGDQPFQVSSTEYDRYPIYIDTIQPIAEAGADSLVLEGSIVRFDGTDSMDDQMIMKYRWNFNYGGETIEIPYSEFEFRFEKPGFYPINLTVFDFACNYDVDQVNVSVLDISRPNPITQGDIVIQQNEYALFNGSFSWDNTDIVNYTWKFVYEGSPIEVYGRIARFYFKIPGYYRATLMVTDTVSLSAETPFNITVIDNEKPIANAGSDIEIENGNIVHLNSSLSTDNGIITNSTWTFLYDGSVQWLFGSNTAFFFLTPGHYELTLNISDQFNNFDIDNMRLTVIDTIPPNALISGSTTQGVGDSISLNGLSSTDNGRVVRYLWEFSDIGPLSVEGPYLNHTFERKGRHNVTLTVYDEWNMSGAVTVIVDVIDQQRPTASAGADISIPAGTVYTFNGSGSTDDGIIVSYRWIFEYDGEEVRLEGETIQFRFEKGGTYNVLLTVTDQTGNWGEDGSVLTVIDKGVLKGTVFDEKGAPVKGAKVTVKGSDGKDYVGLSSINGSFAVDVFMGGATYEITKAGYRSVSGAVTIRPMETTVLDSTGATLEPSSRSGKSPLLFIIAGIVVGLLIGGSVLFFILRRKKEGTEGAASDTSNGSEPSDGPEGPKVDEGGIVEGPVEGEPPVEEMFKAPKEEEIPVEDAGHLTEQMDEFFKEVESGGQEK